MKERASRRCRKTVMPPTLQYRSNSNSNSRAKKRQSTRMRMRAWLEDLLDREVCRGLSWVDKSQNIFCIVWRHASSHGFEESEHGDVFYRWAKHTGKYKPNQGSHSSYKSNFRCALHSLKDCIELTKTGDKKGEKAKRTFQFIDPTHPQYKKKKGEKKIQAVCDDLNEARCTDFLAEVTSSSSSSSLPPSSVGTLQQQQQPCAQSLWSGENIELPCSTSDRVAACDSSTGLVASAGFHNRKTSPKQETSLPKLGMLLDNNTASGLQSMFMQTETNSEGITTIILQKANGGGVAQSLQTTNLPCHLPQERKTVDQPSSFSEPKTSYKLHSSHLHSKLTCGGSVVIKTENEVLPLSIPIQYTCQNKVNTGTYIDLDVASNMEIIDDTQYYDDETDYLNETSNDQYNYPGDGTSIAFGEAQRLLIDPEENVKIERMYPEGTETTQTFCKFVLMMNESEQFY